MRTIRADLSLTFRHLNGEGGIELATNEVTRNGTVEDINWSNRGRTGRGAAWGDSRSSDCERPYSGGWGDATR